LERTELADHPEATGPRRGKGVARGERVGREYDDAAALWTVRVRRPGGE
jgi:hypothetical protein